MYVVNIWVHSKYVVVVCKLQFIGEMLFVLVSPLLVVPTYLTENTEAYGLKLLESTLSLQNSQRFARQESRNDGLRRQRRRIMLNLKYYTLITRTLILYVHYTNNRTPTSPINFRIDGLRCVVVHCYA